MFFEEDEDSMPSEKAKALRRKLIEKSKQEFRKGCYDAYEMIVSKGPKVLDEDNRKSIEKALNRMTALFLLEEEYERCKFIQDFVTEHMPGFVINPDPNIPKELSI